MPVGFERGDFGGDSREPVGLTAEALVDDLRAALPVVGRTWTRWQTAEDERVCPECGPLDGLAWPEGEGPSPPLHNHCRCAREFAFVELSTRG